MRRGRAARGPFIPVPTLAIRFAQHTVVNLRDKLRQSHATLVTILSLTMRIAVGSPLRLETVSRS